MAFIETQFPTDISYGSSGGPEYATDVVISQSGAEQRNVNWTQARARFTVAGNSLKPLAPVKAKAVKNISTNDVTFSWFRRTRVDGNLRDYVDIPLNEVSELYDISVLNGSTVVRSWQTNSAVQIYTSAEQIADFGVLQTAYSITIAQRSAAIGPGFSTSENVIVQ